MEFDSPDDKIAIKQIMSNNFLTDKKTTESQKLLQMTNIVKKLLSNNN